MLAPSITVCLLLLCVNCQKYTVEYLEKAIKESSQNAATYKLDTDFSRYKTNSGNATVYETYDFIIIGSGTAGAVVANRLSENEDVSVLVIEAGTYGNITTKIPGLSSLTYLSDYNYGYYSVKQKYGCLGYINEECACPRGRGVGGSTLIYGMIYSRAHSLDFDKLAAISRDWGYKSVLPDFLKSENFTQTNPNAIINNSSHGTEGLLNVENYNIDNPRTTAFIEANKEIGIKITDYNSHSEEGASLLQVTKKGGERVDTGTAFILPIKDRTNLKILTKSFVTKINICEETKRATSVLFTNKGILYEAKAGREIILSAGAINSPQLLMLSGVGKNLQQFGIKELVNLDVGQNLRDHVFFPLTLTHNSSNPKTDLRTEIEDWLEGRGVLSASGPADGTGFYRSNLEEIAGYPDVKLLTMTNLASNVPNPLFKFLRYKLETLQGFAATPPLPKFSFLVTALSTESVGTVSLKTGSAFDHPLIDPMVLSKETDSERLYIGYEFVKNLTKTEAFKKINATIIIPKLPACADFKSKEEILCVIRQLAIPAFHPLGTCQMGTNPENGAVVDGKLKVYGVKGLRVVDASIFPEPFRAHPAANCIMLGEKAADLIKRDHF